MPEAGSPCDDVEAGDALGMREEARHEPKSQGAKKDTTDACDGPDWIDCSSPNAGGGEWYEDGKRADGTGREPGGDSEQGNFVAAIMDDETSGETDFEGEIIEECCDAIGGLNADEREWTNGSKRDPEECAVDEQAEDRKGDDATRLPPRRVGELGERVVVFGLERERNAPHKQRDAGEEGDALDDSLEIGS